MRIQINQHPGLQFIIFLIIMITIPLIADGIIDITHEGQIITPISSEIQREKMNRGIVAMNTTEGVYLSWRLLPNDPIDVVFDLYRQNYTDPEQKLNVEEISETTDFLDITPGSNLTGLQYYVVPKSGIIELEASESTYVRNIGVLPYISIPLGGPYFVEMIGYGDLNGDGSLDYVVKQTSVDDYEDELSPDTYKIEAYLSNGTFLWRKDLGWDIQLGDWYSPYIVYDFDGDNCSEIILKTGEPGGDHRDAIGHITTGPEYLSVWNGTTGEEIFRTDWIPRWDQGYSWNSRNMLGVAYLDGISPYLIVVRGTYNIIKVEAFRYQNHALTKMWHWESWDEFGIGYIGQGSHWIRSVDVDSDSRDEIIIGSCVLDDNGQGLWTTTFRHADQVYVGEIDPQRPGLEIYYGIEGNPVSKREKGYGMSMVDAKTGLLIWKSNETTRHIHSQGLVSDIDSRFSGSECYSAEEGSTDRWLWSANGTLIGDESIFNEGVKPYAVYWNADLQREVLRSWCVYDFDDDIIHLSIQGDTIGFGDIFGDWREEFVKAIQGELRIYTTTIPAADRRVTLLNDSIYRKDVVHSPMGYMQVPMLSFSLAESSVPYNPNGPVQYDPIAHNQAAWDAFLVNIDCTAGDYLWELIGYASVVVIVFLAYTIAFIRRKIKIPRQNENVN